MMRNLRRLRLQARLTLAELAELAESTCPELPLFAISAQYVHDIETGRNKNPNVLAALRIAAALKCSVADLYGASARTPGLDDQVAAA
jgi:transcriptional regulator with XRE-family HTH domain